MSKFALDIAKFAEKTKMTMDQAARGIKIALFNGIIMDTRVDTGRLRGNWQTSTGTPILSTTSRSDQVDQNSPGGSAYDEVIETVRGDTVDYLTNNLPYAEVREEKDGMVGKNIARISRYVKEVVADVKN